MADRAFKVDLQRFGPSAPPFDPASIAHAQAYCRRLAQTHYENFTVASWLLPQTLRQHFCNIYAFCRWADDLADEVDDEEESLRLLEWWRGQLDGCYQGRASHPVFVALDETITRFDLPQQPFQDLIAAFVRDQHQNRYQTFDELLDYCRCSADPVGRLILHLIQSHSQECVRLSDKICTGLQLANFCQDVARDWERGRIYLPRDTWQPQGYTEADFEARRTNDAFRQTMQTEVERAEGFLQAGQPLVDRVPREAEFAIDLFVRGGLAILAAIRRQRFDVWDRRPTVSRSRKLRIAVSAYLAKLRRLPRRHQ